jgi:Glycosyl hydrolases family 28/Right handed beta helix region
LVILVQSSPAFLFRFLASCALGLLSGPAFLGAETVRAARFGAVPNDGVDDTASLQAALDFCARLPGTTLVLEPGTYDLTAKRGARQVLTLRNGRSVKIEGNGATFVVHSWTTALLVQNCTHIALNHLSFDWLPLPYLQAHIVATEPGKTYLAPAGSALSGIEGSLVTSFFQYDEARQEPARDAFDWYAEGSKTGALKLTIDASGRIALPLATPKLRVGDALILRYHTYGANALFAVSSDFVVLNGVAVHSAPGMAVYMTGCENIEVSNVTVDIPAGSGRWISTNADGLHFTQCRGKIEIANCTLRKMGDDAVNIGSLIMRSTPGPSRRQIILEHGGFSRQGMPPPRIADVLSFSRPESPFETVFSTAVRASPATGMPRSLNIEVSADIPAGLDDAVVVNESCRPVVSIKGCTIGNNRARGLWLQAATQGVIEDTHILGTSGPAIELRADVYRWWEGPPPANLTFVKCDFSNCNYGPGRNEAIVSTYVQGRDGQNVASTPITNIHFQSCTFSGAGTAAAFHSIAGVSITGCAFADTLDDSLDADPSLALGEHDNQYGGIPFHPRIRLSGKTLKPGKAS